MRAAAGCFGQEGKGMSEKLTYVLCVIVFVMLAALMALEMQYPEGGAALLGSLF